MGEWNPNLDDAPKDGTWVAFLIDHGDGESYVEVGRWRALIRSTMESVGDNLYRAVNHEEWFWDGTSNEHAATHWMQIPPPPHP